ncbi:carbohydrate ABC transporter permease [Microlunatus antarcticus]|uniref:Multiple sugar transport system permease protein n=1 Tax=Microlunatus antarcticus TaxID=53388 RepID=A0A7W5JU84_9ACTN|nr:sugar ABC transporter permease [Microlunatus antarcticus]MBB3326416.1 multiple sugar transport system permease protein [Microlunatus antarcticus]
MATTTGLRRAATGVGVAGPGAPLHHGKNKQLSRGAITMVLLVAPSVVLLLLINAYPLIYAANQSLHKGSLIITGKFVGFANYTDVLTRPAFWQAARFTLIFTLVGVFGSWLIGLALALLLRTRIPGGTVFKVLLMLPWVVPIVVSSTAWNWLVATPSSPVPALAERLGFGQLLFLADPTLAAITVCVFKVWVSFPFMMLMTSAALASVDTTVYEAANMDGATKWQQLTQITLPIVSRSTYISWILMTIFCVNDFPTIFLLTGGGPVTATSSLVVLAYRTVFQDFQTGPGVAIAFLMTIVLVIISTVLYRQIRKGETA